MKSHPVANDKRGKLSEYAKATLGSGNMRSAVMLPKGEESNEWLAVNTVDFFNEISRQTTEECISGAEAEATAARFSRLIAPVSSPALVSLFLSAQFFTARSASFALVRAAR